MKLAEILRVLHQMHKDTTHLLFETPVSESEAIRSAVAKADLALGNAASLVRQRLSGSQGNSPSHADVRRGGHNGKAAPQKSTPTAEKRIAFSHCADSDNGKEPPTQIVSSSAEDGLPDDEYTLQLQHNSWDYLDSIQHPSDRPNPRAA
jgi:hypothetical protein